MLGHTFGAFGTADDDISATAAGVASSMNSSGSSVRKKTTATVTSTSAWLPKKIEIR